MLVVEARRQSELVQARLTGHGGQGYCDSLLDLD
jgi:hypothetical protein